MKPTTIYLPEETEANLQELAKQTGKSISELIQEVITDYFTHNPHKLPQSITNIDDKSSTLEILKESGLIGCISAESDLSTHYKSVLTEGFHSKYDHC